MGDSPMRRAASLVQSERGTGTLPVFLPHRGLSPPIPDHPLSIHNSSGCPSPSTAWALVGLKAG